MSTGELVALAQALTPLATLLLSTLVIPWLMGQWSRLPQPRQAALTAAARRAVEAAEQLWRTDQLQNRRYYAERAIKDELARHGLTVSEGEIDSAIEAAVLQLKAWAKDLPAPTVTPNSEPERAIAWAAAHPEAHRRRRRVEPPVEEWAAHE
jgi:superfamily 6 holin (LLH)